MQKLYQLALAMTIAKNMNCLYSQSFAILNLKCYNLSAIALGAWQT
ncbi:hypothetical protein PN450_07775 [Dolichospermum lemmermannii CS-548]|nr:MULTISPECIES: hypothetical protein [Dolichospermum]MDB9436703.1 hypothetical protein [Dolichospermum lemmermannii CS-548]